MLKLEVQVKGTWGGVGLWLQMNCLVTQRHSATNGHTEVGDSVFQCEIDKIHIIKTSILLYFPPAVKSMVLATVISNINKQFHRPNWASSPLDRTLCDMIL